MVNIVIFSDGFESNDFSAWDGTAGSGYPDPIGISSIRHHGLYGAYLNMEDGVDDYSVAYKNIAPETTVYARKYHLFGSVPVITDGDRFLLCDLRKATATDGLWRAGLKNDGGTIKWVIYDMFGITGIPPVAVDYIGPAVTIDNSHWYCVELKVLISATVGELRLYVDGVEVITQTGLNMGTLAGITTVFFGIFSIKEPPYSPDYNYLGSYMDCCVIDSAYIGLEADQPIMLGTLTNGLTISGNGVIG